MVEMVFMSRKTRIQFEIPSSPDLTFEQDLWVKGHLNIAGIDEAGRGAWAGPVVAAVVILPGEIGICKQLTGVRDSKQMNAKQRDYWREKIKELAIDWGIGIATHHEIDQIGILPATRTAMKRAIESLSTTPDHLLIDAVRLSEVNIPQFSLIKGDQRSLSIAAASVLAKTTRDAMMIEQDFLFPQYGFKNHKGYGTLFHRTALSEHGPCSIHRMTFKPLHKKTALFNLASQ